MALSSSASKQPSSSVNPFLRSWAWKREHRPDKDRFDRPYIHKMLIDGHQHILHINQARFSTRGFASTVWDSAIVLSKYFERWPSKVNGKQCIELGAGCGLPGITAACLGASSVLLTDLSENLPLLKENIIKNNVSDTVSVANLEWGRKDDLHDIRTFDVVLAADVMYDASIVGAFLQTVRMVATPSASVFLAYGRNRQAEEQFLKEVKQTFSIERIEIEQLDDVYQCIDVDVFVMRKRQDV
eukprot:c14845_g1_i2 orf=118-843(+)